jgi:hypothetical protein
MGHRQISASAEAALPGGHEDPPIEAYHIVVERKIRELVEQGYFDNLPGAGKPLDLSDEDNPFIPSDMRLAYRILRNAGVSLPWIELGNEVEGDVAELRRQAAVHERRLRSAIGRAHSAIPGLRSRLLASLRTEHEEFVARFEKAAAGVNRKIDAFNISVPVSNLQKPRFRPELYLDRLGPLLPSD